MRIIQLLIASLLLTTQSIAQLQLDYSFNRITTDDGIGLQANKYLYYLPGC